MFWKRIALSVVVSAILVPHPAELTLLGMNIDTLTLIGLLATSVIGSMGLHEQEKVTTALVKKEGHIG